jgi:DNA repair exonuclease SbcCD ATPase subunit
VSTLFDETDFVDRDLQAAQKAQALAAALPPGPANVAPRPPTRQELEVKVTQTQSRIIELKRAQEELERERAALDEARRRRQEMEAGRAEMVEHLTRGIGLLEKAEFDARRSAEQMAKTLEGFRQALGAVQAIKEDTWTQENWTTELTRALTAVENARMEWNSARLKWPILNGEAAVPANQGDDPASAARGVWLGQRSFLGLCKVGFALTWPLAVVALAALVAFVVMGFNR